MTDRRINSASERRGAYALRPSAADPAFKQTRLTAYTLTGHTKTSAALASPATDALLTELFASALAWASDRAFLRGSGVGQPLGVLSWPGLISVTRSAASAVAAADLAGMYARLLPPTDPSRVVWAMHPTALAPLLTACTSFITAPRPSSSPLSPFQVLGHDAFVTDKLPPLNTAGDVLLMDLSYCLIGDRQDLEIAHSAHVSFRSNQHAWRFTARAAGMPWPRDKVTLADGTSLSPFVALAAG